MGQATTWSQGANGPGASLRRECRAMARQRALLAAATSLIPLPGIDLATDLAVMTRLIHRINTEFGLSEQQIDRLSGQRQALIYGLISTAGGKLAARLTTPALLGRLVQTAGIRLTVMEASRLVPIAGQLLAAGIGYWSVSSVALRHIADCERLINQLEGRNDTP